MDEILSQKERKEQKREEKLARKDRAAAQQGMKKWLSGVGLIAVIGLLLGWVFYSAAQPAKERTTREVAMSCTTDMATEYHIHPRISISVKGVKQDVNSNIGVRAGCMNPLHTHDSSGVIHVESPEKRDFALADFFAVWDKPFSKDQLFDHMSGPEGTVKLFVNGTENSEFENYVVKDKDEIDIKYE